MVTAGHATTGSALEVEVPGQEIRRAVVVPKPFLDAEKAIPKREMAVTA
jgi:glycine cleavage system aminomethyltransferase T